MDNIPKGPLGPGIRPKNAGRSPGDGIDKGCPNSKSIFLQNISCYCPGIPL